MKSHHYTIEVAFTILADSADEAALKAKAALSRGKYHFGDFELEAMKEDETGRVVESAVEHGRHPA